MKNIGEFVVHGTAIGKKNSIKLDEISILACPETIKNIGEYLIKAAERMKSDDLEHTHLQDAFNNFSDTMHVDIILLNSKLIHEV